MFFIVDLHTTEKPTRIEKPANTVMPKAHRRRRVTTVELRHVGVGGVNIIRN